MVVQVQFVVTGDLEVRKWGGVKCITEKTETYTEQEQKVRKMLIVQDLNEVYDHCPPHSRVDLVVNLFLFQIPHRLSTCSENRPSLATFDPEDRNVLW